MIQKSPYESRRPACLSRHKNHVTESVKKEGIPIIPSLPMRGRVVPYTSWRIDLSDSIRSFFFFLKRSEILGSSMPLYNFKETSGWISFSSFFFKFSALKGDWQSARARVTQCWRCWRRTPALIRSGGSGGQEGGGGSSPGRCYLRFLHLLLLPKCSGDASSSSKILNWMTLFFSSSSSTPAPPSSSSPIFSYSAKKISITTVFENAESSLI